MNKNLNSQVITMLLLPRAFVKWSIQCLLVGALFLTNAHATEIVKWVDADGKVHYGDKAPVGKEDQAEKVIIKNAPINKPAKNIDKSNREYWLREEQRKKTQKAQNEKQREKRARDEAQRKKTPTLTVEEEKILCRNKYRSNVRKRTQCFSGIGKE